MKIKIHISFLIACLVLSASDITNGAPRSPEELKARLIQEASGLTEAGMSAFVAKPEIAKSLVRHEILRRAGEQTMEDIAKKPQGKAFLDLFLDDQTWMETFLCSGQVGDAGVSLGHLADIWASDPEGVKVPLYRELATATALAYTAPFQRPRNETPVARYTFFKRSHANGKLHQSFENLKAWDMSYLICSAADNKSLGWLQENLHIPLSRFSVAEGCTPYLAMNVFGNSVLTWSMAPGYHGPWFLGGQNMAENYFRHSGVCGTQSNFASYVSVSRGVVAMPAGQIGHCAYAVRPAPHNWIGGFGGPGGSSQGIYGNLSPVCGQLADAIFTKPDAVLSSRRLAWLGHLLKDTDLTKARAAMQAATQAQSLNIEAWLDYVELLTTTEAKSPVDWKEVMAAVIKSDTFKVYPTACGMKLFDQVYDLAGKNLTGEGRRAALSQAYAACAPNYWAYTLEPMREKHCDSLPTPELQALFAKAMLGSFWKYASFGDAWGWVNQRFANKPGSEAQMLEIFNQSFISDTPTATQGWQIGNMIGYLESQIDHPNALAAMDKLEKSNFEPYFTLSESLKNNREACKKLPPHPTLPGELLSKGGLIRLSSTSGTPDLNLLHRSVLTETGGLLQTAPEKNPSVVVRLGKPGDLTGIIITNYFDGGKWNGRAVPLNISVSDDNKTWTPVTTLSKHEDVWTVNLEGKGIKAHYVKLETTRDREYLFLRQILVYGTPSK